MRMMRAVSAGVALKEFRHVVKTGVGIAQALLEIREHAGRRRQVFGDLHGTGASQGSGSGHIKI